MFPLVWGPAAKIEHCSGGDTKCKFQVLSGVAGSAVTHDLSSRCDSVTKTTRTNNNSDFHFMTASVLTRTTNTIKKTKTSVGNAC